MRHVLAPLRLVALLLLIFAGLALTAFVYPHVAQRMRNRILRRWSRTLLAICGARIRLAGRPLSDELAQTGIERGRRGRMILANHVSWVDVFAIDAALPSRFVAKAEIGRWPVAGKLVTMTGTLYIERGRRHAVAAANHRVREHLAAGEAIAIFPEGTTTDGSTLLPFHSNLIAPAMEAGCEIWPVALRYTEGGRPTTAAAFVGDMGLAGSLWNILLARDLEIEVTFLEPVAAAPSSNRHQIAHAARQAIARHLGVPAEEARAAALSPPWVPGGAPPARADPATGGTAPETASDRASASR